MLRKPYRDRDQDLVRQILNLYLLDQKRCTRLRDQTPHSFWMSLLLLCLTTARTTTQIQICSRTVVTTRMKDMQIEL